MKTVRDSLWLIGVDDTDMPETRGTGRLARMLSDELGRQGLACCGVTRHQLLVHPDVPYTSHNSAACVGMVGEVPTPANAFRWICDYVADRSPAGSDPGVCMTRANGVGEAVREFGLRAQQVVLRLDEARRLASDDGCLCAGLAGSESGVIGALAAVGLRAGGGDGRFIELGRIRELDGAVRACDLIGAGIDALSCSSGPGPKPDERVETFGWVRPRLMGGRAILFVERSRDHGVDWVVSDRRSGERDSGSAV